MEERMKDARSGKIIFVSSCLLNTNNKVKGLARYPGLCKDVFDTLEKYGLGIMQMQCPETLYLGIQRWWATKNLYDKLGFRTFCRTLARQIADYMEAYVQAGYETVAVLSCDGSPTCGVTGRGTENGAAVRSNLTTARRWSKARASTLRN